MKLKYLSDLKYLPEYSDHELVCEIEDKETKLRAFIAIHNTNLGPATGGTRFFFYKTKEDALNDVLRLSKAMTYKCALANVNYGGGKAVIIGDPKEIKTDNLLKLYASAVNELKGKFTTGEDVGLTNNDIMLLSRESKYIHGRPNGAGDLAPWAALGVFYSIKSALAFKFGSRDIKGHSFAIKGVGKVGAELCQMIYKEGGEIVCADVDENAIEDIKKCIPKISIVNSFDIHKQNTDVYCPCALGNEFNIQKAQELKCKIVCGAANNQLVSKDIGGLFYKNKITYIPDYVANAGGLINITSEIDGKYDRSKVEKKIKNIEKVVTMILKESRENNKPENYIADEIAKKIIYAKK